MKTIKNITILSLFLCLIFTSNCKKADKFLIQGTWDISVNSAEGSFNTQVQFSGVDSSGAFQFLSGEALNVYPNGGTYTVNGQSVVFSAMGVPLVTGGAVTITFNGSFSNTDLMVGSGEENSEIATIGFTWAASRI
jgi:hypothetical protein